MELSNNANSIDLTQFISTGTHGIVKQHTKCTDLTQFITTGTYGILKQYK